MRRQSSGAAVRRGAGPMVAAVVAALVVALLAGCSPSTPDLSPAAATRMQSDVLAATRLAAEGDLPAARAALAALTQSVASAASDGDLSPERRRVIEASITAVAADLTALEVQRATRAAADAAAAAAADKATAAHQAAADKAAADKKAAEKGNSGPGKGEGSKK